MIEIMILMMIRRPDTNCGVSNNDETIELYLIDTFGEDFIEDLLSLRNLSLKSQELFYTK